jgi:hypothetical protein
MKRCMHLCGLVWLATLMMSVAVAQELEMPWPENIVAAASRINAVLREAASLPPHDVAGRAKQGEAFDAALGEMAKLASADLVAQARAQEYRSEAAKLLLIAADRRDAPARYDALRERYLAAVAEPAARAPAAPPLSAAEATEAYRLAWEYWLLRPPLAGQAPQANQRMVDALVAIDNPASVQTVMMAVEATASDKAFPGRARAFRQHDLLQILGRMPGENSLQALMRSVTLIDNPPASLQSEKAGAPTPQPDYLNAATYAERLLTDAEHFGTASRWRAVLNRVPEKDGATADDDIVRKAQAFYRNNPVGTDAGKTPQN